MLLVATIALAQSKLAQTPPMGWNSYDCFSYAVNEAETMANAEFMAKNLLQFGWEYVVVDYVWSAPRGKATFAPDQDANFQPRLRMDEYGRLLPDVARFPSAKGDAGFKPLADRLHKLGLKFGIHLMRGIPRQAVAANTAIRNTKYTAVQAGNKASTCPWLNHMFGLNMKHDAGQAYLDSIFGLYAKWGVDLVKVDDLSRPYSNTEIEGYRRAIDRCGRPIALSLSPGPAPIDQGAHVAKNANMWRLLDDLWDNWPQLNAAFDKVAEWTPYRGPGHWPDPDMLPLGRLRKFGPSTGPANTDARLSKDEAHTLMSLWSIMACPLMFGGNLPETDPETLKLLTNTEVLAVNQHSKGNRALRLGPTPIYAATDPTGRFHYIAMFSRKATEPVDVKLRLSDLGIKKCAVRDLWTRTGLETHTDSLTIRLPRHGSALLRLHAIETCKPTTPVPYKMEVLGTSYEAESELNTLTGQTHADPDPAKKASGGKTVKYVGNKPENRIRFNGIKVDKAGRYVVTVVYSTAEDRTAQVSVNGAPPITVSFESTGGFDGDHLDTTEFTVDLKEGENSIEFGNDKYWTVDLDRIAIRPEKK